VLAVPQFTLAGDVRKGRRPSFDLALPGPEAAPLFATFVAELRALGVPTETGVFGAAMLVTLGNDGPVTLVHRQEPRSGA
jgi:D-tyrosyl-tRNA(Tyr) deacylase